MKSNGWMYHRGRKGFTLIELLVVVSIVALLISILLPAVGAARRRAKISACVQNMKQHGIGVQSFAAANNDTLPNAPSAPPTDDNKYGYAGRVAQSWGTNEFPVNGFQFPSAGVPTWRPFSFGLDPNNPTLPNGSFQFKGMSFYNGYWMIMSEYMTEGEGIDAMADVFYCPSDKTGPEVRDSQSRKFLIDNDGLWPGLGTNQMQSNFRVPSYRYVGVGVLDPRTVSTDREGNNLVNEFNFRGTDLTGTDPEGLRDFYSFVRRNPQSSVDFPSAKVMFFIDYAYHNPNRTYWWQPGAEVTVAMGDGSASSVIADQQALPESRTENAGSNVYVVFAPPSDDEEQGEDTTITYYCPFLHTWGGIRGRDL